jgi:hypothetical protein
MERHGLIEAVNRLFIAVHERECAAQREGRSSGEK